MILRYFLLTIIMLNMTVEKLLAHRTEESSSHSTTITVEDDEEVPISDPRFFTSKLFHKYGEGSNIPFEGFEHLMENLGLGNIDIKDHDVGSHKQEEHEFLLMHETHEHSKDSHDHDMTVTPPDKRGQRAAAQDQKHSVTKTQKTTDDGHRHGSDTHNHSYNDQNHEHGVTKAGTDFGRTSHSTDDTEVDHTHQDDHVGNSKGHNERNNINKDVRDHESEESFPELLDASFSLVEHRHYIPSDDPRSLLNRKCLSPRDILETFQLNPNASLNTVKFLLICPAIIWELDQQHCVHRHQPVMTSGVTFDQWIYSTLAVIMISLCGLFSVAIIPIMQKWFYHTLLQFLVGLAIGSLSGDALLHLLPHAMIPNGNSHNHSGEEVHKETAAVWRGMMALVGIYFFFLAERFLNAIATYRKQKKLSQLSTGHNSEVPVHDGDDADGFVGEKLSHYRKNSYGVKIGTDGKEAIQMLPYGESAPPNRRDSRHSSIHEVTFHGRSSFTADPQNGPLYYPPQVDSSGNFVTVTEHHGHGHGHSHEVPQSVSAVAWMVIMGDGLHNFCDGMAIGAAFASGLAGGISTTVAVFCHELPHELGDFAMLLKTGMKVKEALLYNGLSSVLCLIGMTIGLSLGGVESATSWIFAATAGMFIYIALVDMLPELSTANADPNATPTYTLAVQVLGISIGVTIMLLIANFEHELVTLFS